MIDWNRIQALHDEVGAEDFDEIVELFLEEVESIIARVSDLMDRSTLGEDLHFLKGSALSLGFTRFSDLCQAGETAAEKGQADTINVEEIIQAYDVSKQVFLADLSNLKAA